LPGKAGAPRGWPSHAVKTWWILDPNGGYPAWKTYKKLLKMAIEIVDLPIKNGDFP